MICQRTTGCFDRRDHVGMGISTRPKVPADSHLVASVERCRNVGRVTPCRRRHHLEHRSAVAGRPGHGALDRSKLDAQRSFATSGHIVARNPADRRPHAETPRAVRRPTDRTTSIIALRQTAET